MEHQSIMYGGRKGKQTAFKQMLSGVAIKSLRVFPVPGLDVLLAKGFNPHQKGVNIFLSVGVPPNITHAKLAGRSPASGKSL